MPIQTHVLMIASYSRTVILLLRIDAQTIVISFNATPITHTLTHTQRYRPIYRGLSKSGQINPYHSHFAGCSRVCTYTWASRLFSRFFPPVVDIDLTTLCIYLHFKPLAIIWLVSPSKNHIWNMLAHQIMTVSPSSHDFYMIDYKRTMVEWNPFFNWLIHYSAFSAAKAM